MATAKLISPITKQSVQKIRVAAYCRVSSSSADQLNSYTRQIESFTKLIKSHSEWELVDIFADAPVIIGLKQNPTQTGAALVLFYLFTGIFETFR